PSPRRAVVVEGRPLPPLPRPPRVSAGREMVGLARRPRMARRSARAHRILAAAQGRRCCLAAAHGDTRLRSYKKSEAYLERAERVIPLGSQTFSKSRTQYPHGVSPYFITHGQGSRVWDLDGNEYIDFVNSLASVTL